MFLFRLDTALLDCFSFCSIGLPAERDAVLSVPKGKVK